MGRSARAERAVASGGSSCTHEPSAGSCGNTRRRVPALTSGRCTAGGSGAATARHRLRRRRQRRHHNRHQRRTRPPRSMSAAASAARRGPSASRRREARERMRRHLPPERSGSESAAAASAAERHLLGSRHEAQRVSGAIEQASWRRDCHLRSRVAEDECAAQRSREAEVGCL